MTDIKSAEKWLKYAKTDYDVAVYVTTFHPLPIEIVCFHCQQSAEKALKSVLVYYEQIIPKIHDLSRVWDMCVAIEPNLPDLEEYADKLSGYAIAPRYPDALEYEEIDMRRALQYAEKILNAISDLCDNWRKLEGNDGIADS
jgi:HEPN domain-containing protein